MFNNMKTFFQRIFVDQTHDPRIQFLRYFFSGGSAFVVYFLLLLLLTEWFYQHHLVSLVIAYMISIFVNFFLSRFFVFSRRDGHMGHQLGKFFGVAVFGMLLQYLVVSFLTSVQVHYLMANIVASAVVYVVSFSLNRSITFRAHS